MQYLYRHFDANGVLLYVGVSVNALKRLSQHRDNSHWFDAIASVTIQKYETREQVLDAEREAVINEKPLHNIKLTKCVTKLTPHQAEISRQQLVEKLVQFKPLYTLQEAASALSIGPTLLKRLIENKKIGHVLLGDERIRFTGWQLISFLESEELETLKLRKTK